MGFRERIASLIGGSQVRESLQRLPELEVKARAFQLAATMAPYLFTPDRLLQEMDYSTYVALQGYFKGYEIMGAGSEDRLRTIEVARSRHFFRHDPIAGRQIIIWTDFGFGDRIVLTPKDEQGQEDWEAFVSQNRILFGTVQGQERSYELLVDGELFLVVFVSTVDGSMTVRVAKTDEVAEIITAKGDAATKVWYKRTWNVNGSSQTAYYLDWSFEKADEKDLLPSNAEVAGQSRTDVYMMHVKLPGIDQRGWPLLTSSLDWCSAYGEFMTGRLAVTQATQAYVDKVKAKGGSRALAGIQGLLRSSLATGSEERNPGPAPGADWLENEMVERTRLSQSTGGSDAQTDGIGFIGMAGLRAFIAPHLMNRPDALQNRAVAREMLLPASKQWQRYQSLWVQVYLDLYALLRRSREKYARRVYETDKCTIGRDIPIDIDLDVYMESLEKMLLNGLIDKQTAAAIALNRPEFSLDDPEAVLEKLFPPKEAVAETPEPLPAQQEYRPEEQVAILEAAARKLSGEELVLEGGPGSGHWGHRGIIGSAGGSLPGSMGHAGTRVNREYWTIGPGRHLFKELPENVRENVLATLVTSGVWNSDLDGLEGLVQDPLPETGKWESSPGHVVGGWYRDRDATISLNPSLPRTAGQTFVHELGHHVADRMTYREGKQGDEYNTDLIRSNLWRETVLPAYVTTKRAYTGEWLRQRGLREYSMTNIDEFAADIYKVAVWGNSQQRNRLSEDFGVTNLRKLFPASWSVLPEGAE